MIESRDANQPPDRLQRLAITTVEARERVRGLRVVATRSDVLQRTRTSVHRFYLAHPDHPNRAYEIVLDERGREDDLRALRFVEGRPVLGPPPVKIDRRALRALQLSDPVTISPDENDLVLPFGAPEMTETLTVTIPPQTAGSTKVDIYLLPDTTLSMSPVLDAVQASALEILAAVGAPGFDIAWGVGGYQDFPEDADNPAFGHLLSPTTDLAAVQAAINQWATGNGLDAPEGQLYALDRLARDPDGEVRWRAGAQQIVVWFGDEPGHDPVCAGISGAAADVTEDTLTEALTDAGVTVIAISVTTVRGALGLDGDPSLRVGRAYRDACGVGGEAGQATRITDATGGVFMTGIDSTGIANAIIDSLNQAIRTRYNVQLTPFGQAGDFVTGITPSLAGPFTFDREETVEFQVTFAGTVPCREDETREYLGRIAVEINGEPVNAEKTLRVTVPACPMRISAAADPSATVGRRFAGVTVTQEISVAVGSLDGGVLRFRDNGSPSDPASWTWEDLGGPGDGGRGSSPVMITGAQDGQARNHDPLHVFVRGNDGHLHERVWDFSAWSPWIDHGTPGADVVGLPAATIGSLLANDFGEPLSAPVLVAFARAADERLANRRGAVWIQMERPPHRGLVDIESDLSAPAYPFPRSGPGYLFAVGDNRRLYAWRSTGTAVSTWRYERLGTPEPTPNLAFHRPGTAWYRYDGVDRLYAFVSDTTGRLRVNVWRGTADDGGFWGDQGLPLGTTVAGPASATTATAGGASQLYAFVRGADGDLHVNWWDAATATWKWTPLGRPGAAVASDPSAVSVTTGDGTTDTLFVFVRDGNDFLQVCSVSAALGAPASTWQRLG